jgi:hypothetical protein
MTKFLYGLELFELSNRCNVGIFAVAYVAISAYKRATGNDLYICWKCGKDRTEKRVTTLNFWLPAYLVMYVGGCTGLLVGENLEKIMK